MNLNIYMSVVYSKFGENKQWRNQYSAVFGHVGSCLVKSSFFSSFLPRDAAMLAQSLES